MSSRRDDHEEHEAEVSWLQHMVGDAALIVAEADMGDLQDTFTAEQNERLDAIAFELVLKELLSGGHGRAGG